MIYLALTFTLTLALVGIAHAEKTQELDTLMSKWIGLETQRGQLEKDWKVRKRSLELQYKLLSSEEKALKDVLAQNQSAKDNIESERIALLEQQNTLEKEQQFIKEQLEISHIRLHKLVDQLPPPLHSEALDTLSSLNNSQTTNSNKLDKIVGLLDSINSFQQRVSLNQNSMKLPSTEGEKDVLVKQLYLGLSQGWYVSTDGKFYGYGQAHKGQWQWWHQQEANQYLQKDLDPNDILGAIHIVENPTSAKLLALPIKLQNSNIHLTQVEP